MTEKVLKPKADDTPVDEVVQKSLETVRMIRLRDERYGDVHPSEVDNYKKAGWALVPSSMGKVD